MQRRWLLLCGAAPAVLLVGSSSFGSETTIYTYDTLGRLVATSRTGGPSNGVGMVTCFDPAGNRSQYFIGTSGAPTCPTPAPSPAPTPTPTPANHPPVAVNDFVEMSTCSEAPINFLANDSDPDGDAISVVSISSAGYYGTATDTGGAIDYWSNNINGTDSITYVIQDTHGATATAAISVHITGNPNCTPGEGLKTGGGSENS